MPAKSQAQAKLLNWKFGHSWVKAHHFDNPWHSLPEHIRQRMWTGGAVGQYPFAAAVGGTPAMAPQSPFPAFGDVGGYPDPRFRPRLRTGQRRSIPGQARMGLNSQFMPRSPFSVGRSAGPPRMALAGGGVASHFDGFIGDVDGEGEYKRSLARKGYAGGGVVRIQAKGGYPKGFTQFNPGYGRWEGHWGKEGRDISGTKYLKGKPLEYYGWENRETSPFVALEGERGSLGSRHKLTDPVTGKTYIGIVVDQKGRGYHGYGVLTNRQFTRSGMPTGPVIASLKEHTTFNDMLGANKGGSGSGAPTRRNIGRLVGTASNFFIPGLGLITGPISRGIVGAIQRSGERKREARAFGGNDRRAVNFNPRQINAIMDQGQGERRIGHQMDRYNANELYGIPSNMDISRMGQEYHQGGAGEYGGTYGTNRPTNENMPLDYSNSYRQPQGENIGTNENMQPAGGGDYTYTDTTPGTDFPNTFEGSGAPTAGERPPLFSTSNPPGTWINLGGTTGWVQTTNVPPPSSGGGWNVPTQEGVGPDVVNTYRGTVPDSIGGGDTIDGGDTQGGGGGGGRRIVNPLAHAMGAYDPNENYGGTPKGYRPRAGEFGSTNPNFNRGEFGDYTLNNASPFGANTVSNIGGLGSSGPGGGYFQGHTNLGMALPGSFTNLGQGSHGNLGSFWDRMVMRNFYRGGDPMMGYSPNDTQFNFGRMLGGGRGAIGAPVVNWPGRHGFRFGADVSKFGSNRRQMSAAAGGGIVRPKRRALKGYGRDTVPMALTPGEVVLNDRQQTAVMPIPGLEHRLLPEQLAALGAMRSAPLPRRSRMGMA